MKTSVLLAFLSSLQGAFSAITPPSQDPFYVQPSNISEYEAGDVIRSRSVAPHLVSLLSLPVDVSVKAVYQYLFRTTDSIGDPVGSVVTLLEPYNSDPTKLLGYQAFYDTANPDCSPSYTLRADYKNLGFSVSGLNVSEDIPFVSNPHMRTANIGLTRIRLPHPSILDGGSSQQTMKVSRPSLQLAYNPAMQSWTPHARC